MKKFLILSILISILGLMTGIFSCGSKVDDTGESLAAPSGITLIPGDKQIAVSWLAVPGATSYKVSWGTAPRTYASSFDVSSTAYTITGLTNGELYYVAVSSINSVTSSAFSSDQTATPGSFSELPLAPTITLTAGDAKITVKWNLIGGAKDYKVYYGVTTGNYTENKTITNPTVGSYDLTGLTNGKPYFIALSGINDIGEGSKSAEVSATPSGSISPGTTNASSDFQIETCIDYKDIITVEDGTLKWRTVTWTDLSSNAWRPGEHPDCQRLAKTVTYVTVDGTKFTLPIDASHWTKTTYYCKFNGQASQVCGYWEGKFELSEFGINSNILANKPDNVSDVVKNAGRGSVTKTDKKENEIIILDDAAQAAVFDFSFNYNYTASSSTPATANSAIKIETCIDYKEIVKTEDSKLIWKTIPWVDLSNIFRPGEHPGCKQLAKDVTYVTIAGTKFVLPIDDIHWSLTVYQCNSHSFNLCGYWKGVFELSEFGIDTNVLANKTQSVSDVVKNGGRGSVSKSSELEITILDDAADSAVYDFTYNYNYFTAN